MKKVILTGPESSGKTTLSRQLAEHFQVPWVSEYARSYLDKIRRPYVQNDLYEIAVGQFEKEQALAATRPPFLICDTSFLVLKIWSIYKYNSCHSFILEQVEQSKNDLYLLCACDIPWEADPLRENPDNREELYQLYLVELKRLGVDFLEVRGEENVRLKETIDYMLSKKKKN